MPNPAGEQPARASPGTVRLSERQKLEEMAPWAQTPLPADVRAKGPWGQLDAWSHPGLDEATKCYTISGDVWIHGTGQRYYMHRGTASSTVTYPGPVCTCSKFATGVACVHVRLVKILRGEQ